MLYMYKLTVALAIAGTAALVEEARTDPEGEAYKATYKKTYVDDDDEAARYQIFQDSKTRVATLNKANKKAGKAFGINWMSDR